MISNLLCQGSLGADVFLPSARYRRNVVAPGRSGKGRPGACFELGQLTVMVNVLLVDPLVYSSPEYVATTWWVPAARLAAQVA